MNVAVNLANKVMMSKPSTFFSPFFRHIWLCTELASNWHVLTFKVIFENLLHELSRKFHFPSKCCAWEIYIFNSGLTREREKKRQNERAPPSGLLVVAFFALPSITGPNSPRLRPCFVTILISRALAYYIHQFTKGTSFSAELLFDVEMHFTCCTFFAVVTSLLALTVRAYLTYWKPRVMGTHDDKRSCAKTSHVYFSSREKVKTILFWKCRAAQAQKQVAFWSVWKRWL